MFRHWQPSVSVGRRNATISTIHCDAIFNPWRGGEWLSGCELVRPALSPDGAECFARARVVCRPRSFAGDVGQFLETPRRDASAGSPLFRRLGRNGTLEGGAQMKRMLIAGFGNIFHGDDAFGVEVIWRLKQRAWLEDVDVIDFGIRAYDLAYALIEDYRLIVLIDAVPMRRAPGPGSRASAHRPRRPDRAMRPWPKGRVRAAGTERPCDSFRGAWWGKPVEINPPAPVARRSRRRSWPRARPAAPNRRGAPRHGIRARRSAGPARLRPCGAAP